MLDSVDNPKLDVSKIPLTPHDDSGAPKLSLLGEMTVAAANQARTIYNGATQAGEALGVGHFGHVELTEQAAAPTLSGRWWAQEAGAMAVSLPLILATHKVVGLVAAPIETSLAKDATLAALCSEKFSVGRMAITGALYEGIFKPTNLSAGGLSANGDSLAYSRVKQAAEGGLSFAAMQIVGERATNTVSGSLDRLLSGTAAGGTYGFVHEQSQSVFEQGKIAAVSKSLDAAARGALLGTALSSLGMFKPVEAADLTPVRQTSQTGFLGRTFAGRDILTENASLRTSRTFSDNGQHAEALPHLNKALEAAQRGYGEKSPEAAEVLTDLARSNMFLGNNEAALTSAKSALDIFQSKYGEHSGQTANAWDQISAIHGRNGDVARSTEALDKSLTAGRGALVEGKLDAAGKSDFMLEEADRVRRLSSMYEGLGNKERAAQVVEEMSKPAAEQPELRHD